MKKMKMHDFQDLHREHMKDPAFRKAWKESEEEDRIIRAAIEARIKKKLSQQDLAKKLGTKQSAISRFETGLNKNPTLQFLRDIADAVGLKLEIRVKSK